MLALTLLAGAASATAYNVTFCAQYDVVYSDADSSFGDDYITADGTYPARGARLKVVRNSDSAVIHDGYLQDTGASPGCLSAPLALDSAQTYDVKVKSYASVNGNTLYVYSSDTGFGIYGYGPATYSPTSSTTYTVTTPTGVSQWNIANAVGHAMWRRAAGLSGEVFKFMNEDSPAGCGGCYDRTNDWVYISPTRNDDKYVIAHEFGHMLAARTNYVVGCGTDSCAATHNYGATVDNCYTNDTAAPSVTHEANSKEYQSSAVWEGIAHYYSAAAFNQTDQANCTWVYYKNTDWNLDRDVGDAQENNPFAVSCETYPTNAAFPDYLGNQCTGTLTNRATEYDWLRFFWDLDYDQGVSTTSIYAIWDDADSDDWNATGNGSDTDDGTPCTPTPSYPSGRLRCAADTNGHLTAWDNEDNYNGVNR